MSQDWYFTGAQVVLPNQVQSDLAISVRDGKIEEPGSLASPHAVEVDASGLILMPGIIDLHTDTLEKEINPRPAADFPLEAALQELDKKILACGITTVYHSLHYGYTQKEWREASKYSREEVISAVKNYGPTWTQAKTRFHLRFEVAGDDKSEGVLKFIEDDIVDLLSFMDHTPGQGQYSSERFIANQMKGGMTEEEAKEELLKRQDISKVPEANLRRVAEASKAKGIHIASHDDCSPEKVRKMHDLGVTISEFPINMESAREAHRLGLLTLGGATNSLRGGSLTGNLNVNEALEAGLIDAFCSDYYPPAIINATFRLWKECGWDLAKAVALATRNPAKCIGLENDVGSIATGQAADLLLVDATLKYPRILASFVDGKPVAQMCDLRQLGSRSAQSV